MGNVCVLLLWILTVLGWMSSCQAQCTCSGFLWSQQFDQLAFEYEKHRTLDVVPGYRYDIKCTDTGAVPSWYYNGQEVTESTSAAVHQISDTSPNTKTLKFSEFSADQVGEYTCSKSCGDCTIDINTGNPVINFDMQSTTEQINSASTVLLTYVLMGDPLPTSHNVTWSHNGVPLNFPNPLAVTLITNGLLIAPTFSSDHEGDYTATVTSTAGSRSDSFHFNLEFFPVANLSVECSNCTQSNTSDDSYTLNLQSSVTITCDNTVNTDLDSLKFTWTKDGQPLNEDKYSIADISQEESALMFQIVNFTDAGCYKCSIHNSVGSNSKKVHINVLYHPVISRLSPQQITWVSGSDGRMQVLFEGGFPEPSVIWTRQLKDSLQEETLVTNSNDFLFSGLHSLNLTVTNVTSADAGNYSVTVFNYLGSVTLQFTVDVIASPILVPITMSPLVRATGSEVTVEVAIRDAYPPVVVDDITWTPSGGVKTSNESYAALTLSDVSPGNPSEVTVVVSHPAKSVNYTFQLTILDPPSAPVNFSVTRADGKTCEAIFTWQPDVLFGNTTIATTETFGLEVKKGTSGQWEEVGNHNYSIHEPASLTLEPEVAFEFRAYSWSHSVGKGKATVGEEFDTITANPQISVESLKIISKNSSSISITWSTPLHDIHCYKILGYDLSCKDLADNRIVSNTTIEAAAETDASYSRSIGNLSPDTSFECSVSVSGEDSVNNPILDQTVATEQGYTLPRPPPQPPSLSVVDDEDDVTADGNDVGVITLDLTALRNSLTPRDASHVWIAVLRLGGSPTLPGKHPDVMYPDQSSFSDPSEAGSPSVVSASGQYRPYVAQEFDVGSIPVSFIIGNGAGAQSGSVRRQVPISAYNGPLETSDFYTAFARVFSPSSLSPDKQYKVFRSSDYIIPKQPASEEPTASGESKGGTIAVVTVFSLLVVVGVAVAVVVGIFVCYHYKRDKEMPNRHKESANCLTVEENTSDVQLKSYTNGIRDDRGDITETEAEKLPLDECVHVLENQPMAFRNPHYDHLPEGAGQLTPSETSASPAVSPLVSEKVFFEESEGSPSLKHSGPPSPVSNSSEEYSDGGMKRTRQASQRISREGFQEHVDELDADKQAGFTREFTYIQDHSAEYPATASRDAQPFSKNRYRNIPAFDHTRVKLKSIPNVPHSDYINANLVKGYDDNKFYIATQGPMYETHCDFWRMVWEQKSTTIVMLTKVVEACQQKCYKYWPEVDDKSKAYGDFVVRQDQHIVLPYYTIRSFKIVPAIGSGTERTVLQFHYTDWPDKNVPALASSLLDFLRAVKSSSKDGEQGPIVVHCSAGVGRTGTIIALDMCLDQLQHEETVDVRGVVAFLREHRSQMIQVLPQYIFLHHALLESIVYGDSSVLLKEFPNHYKYLQTDNCKPIDEEFDKICKVKPPAQANSDPDIVELESASPMSGQRQQLLFAAHYVDGYWEKRKFIACDHPSAETVGQFWQLVWDKKCSAIVMVTPNDFQHFGYLQDVNREAVFGNLRIKVEKQQSRTGFTSRNIVITNDFDGTSWNVRHMQYECWVSSRHFNTPSFVKFVNETVNQAELPDTLKHPIIVHDDGACGSAGALVTLAYCFQRVKQERIIDLLQAVNRLHLQCPNLIQSLRLYSFCYDCLQEFTTKLLREDSVPPIYENIASIRGRVLAKSPSPDPQQELIESYDIV